MSTQLRWIAAAVAALAVGQVSAQGYYAYPNYGSGNGYGNGYTRFVRCESYSGQSNFCRVNAQGRVFIARQLSRRLCIRGRNWNADYRGIWVGGGCRADFAIVPVRRYRQDGGYAAQYNGPGPGGYAGNGYPGNGYAGNGYPVNPGRSSNPDGGYYNNGSRDAYRADANRDSRYNDPRYGSNDQRNGGTDPGYETNDQRNGANDPGYETNDQRNGANDPGYGTNDQRNGSTDPRTTNNPRDEDRAGSPETCAMPDENGYCNPPRH